MNVSPCLKCEEIMVKDGFKPKQKLPVGTWLSNAAAVLKLANLALFMSYKNNFAFYMFKLGIIWFKDFFLYLFQEKKNPNNAELEKLFFSRIAVTAKFFQISFDYFCFDILSVSLSLSLSHSLSLSLCLCVYVCHSLSTSLLFKFHSYLTI